MTTDAPADPPADAPAARARLPRRRRYVVRGLLAAGFLLAVISIFAVWANRQMLDADNWADTSSAMLEHDAIRGQVSQTVVDEVYAKVDVAAEVGDALPPRLKPLAGPAANGLRELAQQRMNKVLGRPRIQQLWEAANRVTAQQFINIAEGKSKAITQSGNAVILDLRPLAVDLATRLGLPRSTVDRVPADAAQVKIMSGNQVGLLQDVVNGLRGLGVVLPALTFVLWGLAIYLSGFRRRETLLAVGLDLIVAGLLVLVLQRIIGSAVVDSLAKTDAARPAADAVWSIGTSMLHEIAQAGIVLGIPIVFAAWLAGPRRLAVDLRRAMAPTMRDRPGIAFAVVGMLVLLVLAWGPIPATRLPIPILLLIILSALGTDVLRRQCRREFPDEVQGAATAEMRARVTRTMPGRQSARADALERLARLHDEGALTDAEFASEKAALIDGAPVATP